MKFRAAAKGRKLLFLAAVCLLSALLLSPTAEASRGLSASHAIDLEPPIPSWDAPAEPVTPSLDLFHLEDDLLFEILVGVEPEEHVELLEHRRLELLPPSTAAAAIQKTASGVSTNDLRLNIQKGNYLKPDLRWTVPFYAKARFYDPEVGRFLSEDPAEPDLTTPPSLHRYLYAYGNPTVYVDPDGRISILSDLSAAFGDTREGLIAAAGHNTSDESTGFFARGWRQFHTSTLAVRAGLVGIAQGGVDLLNFGVNSSLVNQQVTMGLSFGTLTNEATAELLEGANSLVETVEIVRENPKAVAATVFNNAKDVAKAAMEGDHEAQARIQALITEVAVDVAIGSKGVKSAVGIGARTTGTLVDTSHDVARGIRRTAGLVNDVDVPSVRLPKPKPKPRQPRASVPRPGVTQGRDKLGRFLPKNGGELRPGGQFEDELDALLREFGDPGSVGRQVRIQTQAGTTTIADNALRLNGRAYVFEGKSSATAGFTKGQRTAHPEIRTGGGTITSRSIDAFPRGTSIPQTRVKVVRPADIPRLRATLERLRRMHGGTN